MDSKWADMQFSTTGIIRESLLNLMAPLPHPDSMRTFARPPCGQTNNSSHARCTKHPVIERGATEWKRTLKCARKRVFFQCSLYFCVFEK